MLPTMPPASENCELSYKDYDSLSNMEKAIFSSFLESIYDTADSKRLVWAPDDSGQILKAFHDEMAQHEKYIIYANGNFAGFYVMLPCENNSFIPDFFISKIFGKGVTVSLEEYLASK